jgi:hypothetical protein
MWKIVASSALITIAITLGANPVSADHKPLTTSKQPSPAATDISAAYRYYHRHRAWRSYGYYPYRRAYYARPYYRRAYYPYSYASPYYSYASYYPRPYYRPFRPFFGFGYPFGFGLGFGLGW